jgi:glyoxylase-like metal-dependent hydrolase (beta-lactamase superfamily II)/rhodanese-related sulfurtransferase
MMTAPTAAVTPHMIVDEGLGNTCYILDLGDGSALVVDPPRDLRRVHELAKQTGLRIRFAADTHLHADFLSGARQLGHDLGATVLASAAGDREFAHHGLRDGDEIDLGGLRLTVLATPGHTYEHISLVISDGERPSGVFTGGSLIVGSAARTDLLGAEFTEDLTRAQYRSLSRLAGLPTSTAVWPTHGAGSFCSAPPGTARTSTIGDELATNALLGIDNEDRFVTALIESLGSYPAYFRRLTELNRRGPVLLETDRVGRLADLPAYTVHQLRADGATVVDTRPVADYAAGHIPGAISIPLREQFATWLGWLIEPTTPVVIVRNPDQDPADIVWAAVNIGFDGMIGELADGIDTWSAAGHRLTTTRLIRPGSIAPDRHRVLDVRQDSEHSAGHLPDTAHVELGALSNIDATDLPRADRTVLAMCGHGERAASAASLLERRGYDDVAILDGGPDDWARSTGQDLTTGSDQ